MKLSFVIPAYNEEIFLKKCLDSVKKEIDETLLRFQTLKVEVIVVNNASTDNTKVIANSFSNSFSNLKVVDENHKGLVWARKAGFLVSSSELIANIDADTVLPQGWLENVLLEFEKDKNLVALSGPFIYYDLSSLENFFVKVFYFAGYVIYLFNHFVLNKGAMLQGGNFIVKRDALVKMGGFDTSIEFFGEDTDVARRISSFGKVLWTFRLPMFASGRRLEKEGVVKTGIKYAINFLWISIFGVPFTKKYTDVRILK